MDVANKTVLITGANRGIGRALVEEALRRGARRVYAGTRTPLEHPDKRVTPLTLDVTDASQIERAAAEADSLDVLINNAGIAIYDDLSDSDVLEKHLAVNLLGMAHVTQAFLPQLKRSKGAIVNNLSLAALAPLPVIPGYSISKAAALNMTQSLRALLASEGVTVHAVVLGPIDTDMNRGFDIPKASPEAAARGILDGLARGEEEIFPDPASQSVADGWRSGAAKALERQFAAFAPKSPASPPVTSDRPTTNTKEERIMKKQSFTTTLAVDQTPEEVFDAVNDVRGWWSGEIDGGTDKLGAEFTYRYKDLHYSTQKITEWVPGKRVVWHVVDSRLDFVKDKTEWNGTDVVFEISRKNGKTELRFTHSGLVPAFECYGDCSGAWGFYINESLRSLITSGKGQPNEKDG